MIKDKEYLQFIYDRMIFMHGESPNSDYMIEFKKIINNIKESNIEKKIRLEMEKTKIEEDLTRLKMELNKCT